MTQHDDNNNKAQDNVVSLNPKPSESAPAEGLSDNIGEKKHNNSESAEIDKRINTLKAKHGLNESEDKQAKATNDGVKAGVELLTPIVVCFFIGMGLDNWLDKSPLFLMLFFVLGVITGFWNIYKLTK
jgi:ATP synthase protein I